jgi:alpha-L-fucosidase 2
MGNGRIGACVWGGIEREVINLNEDSLWTGEPGYEINPKALPALPEVRRLLLAGQYAAARMGSRQKDEVRSYWPARRRSYSA